MTGLTELQVARRLGSAAGQTLVRNVFADDLELTDDKESDADSELEDSEDEEVEDDHGGDDDGASNRRTDGACGKRSAGIAR